MTITETVTGGDAVAALLTPEAVRTRCAQVWEAGLAGRLDHFTLAPEAMDATADYVVDTIRANYRDLAVPYHARWRHFTLDGTDLWRQTFEALPQGSAERARARFDLCITSVLLDAGAGTAWRYAHARSGRTIGRSEGLALASLDAFEAGLFSSDPARPLKADAQGLADLTEAALARAFQVGPDNPLVGLEGRVGLLNRLGAAIGAGAGHLYDVLAGKARDGRLEARQILLGVLGAFGSIWPGRLTLDGVNLGDTWRHPAVRAGDGTDGLVPFHKLSQWLSYSLVEPLEEAGIAVTDLDQLTGLAEYRNGGLLVDCGLLKPRHGGMLGTAFAAGHPVIVEWRALTVAGLDALAGPVRARLGRDAASLPLAAILEGGTWAAGRRIAAERRHDAAPPIALVSDGSVF